MQSGQSNCEFHLHLNNRMQEHRNSACHTTLRYGLADSTELEG